jgi:nitric oxide reductase subunit C
VYNVIIYTQKSSGSITAAPKMTPQALAGEHLWQQNNCTACHQLYGLGGYLGPDLTNVISNPTKGADYVEAFLNSGVKSMPKYHFSAIEKDRLVAFLTHVDKTGIYPNKDAVFSKDGWVTIIYK